MKKFFALPLVALMFTAACSDVATSPLGFDGASESRGRSQGGGTPAASHVPVAGTFQVVIPGSGGVRTTGPGINEEGKELGTCGEGGMWWNPSSKNWSNSIPHAHCTRGGDSRTVTWNFAQLATFMMNNNNINLNFKDLVDHTVHFKGNQNSTAGQGIFSVTQDGGTWTLDLNQFDMDGNAFAACSTFKCLSAVATFEIDGQTYTPDPVQLTW